PLARPGTGAASSPRVRRGGRRLSPGNPLGRSSRIAPPARSRSLAAAGRPPRRRGGGGGRPAPGDAPRAGGWQGTLPVGGLPARVGPGRRPGGSAPRLANRSALSARSGGSAPPAGAVADRHRSRDV